MKRLPSWKFWDWDSISKTIAVFALLIVALAFFKYYPEYSRNSNLENLPGKTFAFVNSIEPVKHIEMGFEGNKVYNRGYQIHYLFTIDSVTYESSDYIMNTAVNQELLNNLKSKKEKIIVIAYDPKDPASTQIITY